MASERVGAGDRMDVAVAGPSCDKSERPTEAVVAYGAQDFACYETGPDGKPREVWRARAKNGVVAEGYAALGNVLLGARRATTNGPFLVLHNAGYNVTHNWGALSASQVSGYSASLLPLTFVSTNGTQSQWTAATNMSFSHAGTQTVSGCALIFYSSASCATNPSNSSDVRVYNIGSFTAAQNVQSNNTLSITVSLNIISS